MNKIVIGLLGITALSGCYLPFNQPVPNFDQCSYKNPPSIQLSKDSIKRGDNLTITASVFNGSTAIADCQKISKVVFYNNFLADNIIGEDTTEPYNVVWTITAGEKGVPATGSADMPISAVATYADGKTVSSTSIGLNPNNFLKLQP
jgi:Bacterial Ig domain